MEYTVNQQNIQKYAERLTNDLCRQFFINKAFISGPEILSFNTENQLNLLIIKNIFLNWQKEALKLKSPFFDYDDEAVKAGLKVFMNNLSNHIKVYRYDFEPIVKRSISDFILLSAAPQDFFTKEIESLASPKISTALLKDFAKYIKINRFVIDQVIHDIEASGYTETFGGETIRFVLKTLTENPDKIQPSELALQGLFDQLPAEVTEFVALPKPLVTRPSFMDAPKMEIPKPEPMLPVFVEPVVIQKEEQNVATDLDDSTQTTEENEPEVKIDFEVAPSLLIDDEKMADFTPVSNLDKVMFTEDSPSEEPHFQKTEPISRFLKPKIGKLETFEMAKDPINLNDTLRMSEERPNLAQALNTKTVSAPFKTLVPMHYRFTFINSLFGGNQQAWAEAVDKIDKTDSYEEAISMLKSEFAVKFNWDQEEDNAAILFNYVERKF